MDYRRFFSQGKTVVDDWRFLAFSKISFRQKFNNKRNSLNIDKNLKGMRRASTQRLFLIWAHVEITRSKTTLNTPNTLESFEKHNGSFVNNLLKLSSLYRMAKDLFLYRVT